MTALAAAVVVAAGVWSSPGADPYRGTPEHALDLLSIAAPRAVLDRLYDLPAAACRWRDVREGEVIDAMVFGRNSVELNVVAHPDRWPASTPRAVLECRSVAGGLLWPVACGNWYYEQYAGGLPPALPFGPTPISWLPPAPEWVPGWEWAGSWIGGAPGEVVNASSVPGMPAPLPPTSVDEPSPISVLGGLLLLAVALWK